MIQMNKKYMDNVASRLVHVFITRPFGNTSTEPPTKEEMEAFNKQYKEEKLMQEEVIHYLYKHAESELTEDFIHGLHKIIKKNDPKIEKGVYKKMLNFVPISSDNTFDVKAKPEETPQLMKEWIAKQNQFLSDILSEEDTIRAICKSHIEFETIHPYQDGNGKVGRALMMFFSLKKGLLPIVVVKQQRWEYGKQVEKKDPDGLYEIIKKNLDEEKKVWEALK